MADIKRNKTGVPKKDDKKVEEKEKKANPVPAQTQVHFGNAEKIKLQLMSDTCIYLKSINAHLYNLFNEFKKVVDKIDKEGK
jgi:cell division protein FtsL